MLNEHENCQRLAVRMALKRILGIKGDSMLSNPELAALVEERVRDLRGQVEAYELAAILRDRREPAGRAD